MSSVDIFGRQLSNKRKYSIGGKSDGDAMRGPPGEGFKFTEDGNYDIAEKKLCHIADAQDMNDAVSKKVALSMIKNETNNLLRIMQEDSEKYNTEVISKLTIKVNTLQESVEKSRHKLDELSTEVASISHYLTENLRVRLEDQK